MREVELLIIGSGPAGLCAAISAASSGAKVLILERGFQPGGQQLRDAGVHIKSLAIVDRIENGEIVLRPDDD